MRERSVTSGDDVIRHQIPSANFDQLARGSDGLDVVRLLRHAERSRRLFLLRAIVDEAVRTSDPESPLPSPEDAWELLAGVQEAAPQALELTLAHPYLGTWAGYTLRRLRHQIAGEEPETDPLWFHVGHLHAIAAAAAIRGGLAFKTKIPVWRGGAMLPTLGMARLADSSPFSTAEVVSAGDVVEIRGGSVSLRLPHDLHVDAPNWWGVRQLVSAVDGQRLTIRLDDLDPYRSLSTVTPPQRLEDAEVAAWRGLVDDAWRLIVRHLPDLAKTIPAGLDSLVPRPEIPFGNLSASTGEAFGSAIIAKPADAESLAATLVHEFQHIRLSGLLYLTELHDEDPRQRFYTPWRDDPRPVGGVLQGVYAFFGVAMFWRALANDDQPAHRRAAFEFARWRAAAWRVLLALRADSGLTEAGRRFVEGIAERLGSWQDEPVPADLADLAASLAADHYAGWRLRHLRPPGELIDRIARSWVNGRSWPAGQVLADNHVLTPEADGSWSSARADMVRFGVINSEPAQLAGQWSEVRGATEADYLYTSGRHEDAVRCYLADLAADPDLPAAWVGLGLALFAIGREPEAARALLERPELVRAVHRRVRQLSTDSLAPVELAGWIGAHIR